MQVQFSFKHMRTSPSLRDYTERKVLEKIAKFVTKPTDVQVTFSKDGIRRSVHCVVKGGDGFNLVVESENGDMRSAVDLMLDKLETQLKRHKERIKDHKGKKRATLYAVAPIDADDDYYGEPIDADDVIKFEQARRKAAAG